ncbi:MAG: hypothetical protein JRC60_08135 [Deltaproteobacteria bacterium]|nr:hypothetical protein [Deltaproteobacteria bacterium]
MIYIADKETDDSIVKAAGKGSVSAYLVGLHRDRMGNRAEVKPKEPDVTEPRKPSEPKKLKVGGLEITEPSTVYCAGCGRQGHSETVCPNKR